MRELAAERKTLRLHGMAAARAELMHRGATEISHPRTTDRSRL